MAWSQQPIRWIFLVTAILSLFVFPACGDNPCAQEWYAKCTCCQTEQEKNNCRAYMERTNIRALPYRVSEEQSAGCRQKIKVFRCEDEAALNLREWCNPPAS